MDLFFDLVKEFSPNTDELLVTTIFLSIKGALQYKHILGEDFFNSNIKYIRSQFEVMVA